MLEELNIVLSTLPAGLAFVMLGVITLAFAGIIKDLFTPYSISDQLTNQDNSALGLSLTGYYIGVIVIFIGAMYDPADNVQVRNLMSSFFLLQLAEVLGYSVGGIVALNIARVVVAKLVLHKFDVKKEIIEDRNAGTGAVEFGSYVASAFVIAGAISGKSPGPWWFGAVAAAALFGLGQLVLVIYSKFYQLICSYDIHDEIERDNVPAGVAFGGNLVAIGLIQFKAVAGNFESWVSNLSKFAIWSLLGFLVLFLLRILVDRFFMPRSTLSHEIANDRNINAAYLEGAILIGMATILFFAF